MWSDLERLVEASMREWKIPGLALAVVRDGELATACATCAVPSP